ncbi:MAG: long-chain fatty acid--CoA ligase [Desulfohalobiaceae bacterium]|nr:long-chain fatty acid--CoA ligase [Desulfohalobiaceae bacterium]
MNAYKTVSPYWPDGVPQEISGYKKPVYSLLDEAASDYPDQVYTIFNGAKRTYAQVKRDSDKVAAFLVSRGIKKGDRVAVFLPNLPHYPVIYFGILKAGAVCVTCNPMYTAHELQHQLNDSQARLVFCMDHERFYPTAVQAMQDTEVETAVLCSVRNWIPKTTSLLGSLAGKLPKAGKYEPGHMHLDHILRENEPISENEVVDPEEDPAVLIYTGGTTGLPKGAVLTHANLFFDVLVVQEWMRIPHGKGEPLRPPIKGGFHSYLGVLPWYHIFGMTLCLLGSVASSSRLICVPDPRAGNPPFTEVLKLVHKYRPTLLIAVPTIFSAFVNHSLLHKFDLSSLICCASGGAPLPVEMARQFEDKTGAVIFEGYGLSETSPVIAANPTMTEKRKFGSVGFPMPGTDIRIVDIETGSREVEPGEDGEIAVSGPQVMKGYWRNPQADAEVFRELDGKRFFLTGDVGHFDEQGYLSITDRKKDVILVGGFNCYPREVEEVIYQHPAVAQAAVVGVPDEKSGEMVKAFVQLKEGNEVSEGELLQFCRERLAGYKRPRAVEFRDNLPTSAVGKVLRKELRKEEL